MAVQAQYPSNIHHILNNRNDSTIQQGKIPLVGGGDYALMKAQQQSGNGVGLFLDHSINTMPVHHNTVVMENNSRKRARDSSTIIMPKPSTTTANLDNISPLANLDNISPLISIPRSKFVDLNQLHSHKPHSHKPQQISKNNFVSTGLGLAFGDQQQQKISPQSSVHSSVMLSHIKQQRHAQGEELRRTLAEKKQIHYRMLLTAAEESWSRRRKEKEDYRTLLTAAAESLSRRLKEKEAEVEKAARRNVELETKSAQLSLEVQAWQTRAMMQENYAATLQLQLQQGIISGGGMFVCGGTGGGQLQDGDEWEGGNSTAVIGGDAEDAESAFIDPDRVVVTSQPSCKACRNRVASVVLLPCRHMCLCTECDAVAQACPICLSVRCSSIGVLFS